MTPSSMLERFLAYLDASPTPHHAARNAAGLLEAQGFAAVDVAGPPQTYPAGFRGFVHDEGSLLAFRVGQAPIAEAGFRVIAAHTDSPNLRVKPQPLQRSHGYVRLGVEVYGGVQIPTWVDRDLGVAGVAYVREGARAAPRLVDVRRPVARIPTLAIHLNRGVNEDGLKLNAQTQLPAVLGLHGDDGPTDPLRALLASELGVSRTDVISWDLSLFDLTPPTLGGANDEFVFSARLDNLGSCHAGLEGLFLALDAEPDATSVLALFDHEEIGSRTARGADSQALPKLLRNLEAHSEATAPGGVDRALSNTWLLSADMAHAVHPAFADKSDPEHAPRMNAGPAIKVNANYRYTSEGATAAAFALLCEQVEVPHQWFLTRADMRCGSTVGPMLASHLGVRGVDVGNPMLSMHSAREQCGAHDHARMAKVMREFLVAPLPAR